MNVDVAIYGLPGTGKTTELESILTDELNNGVRPGSIAGVTFRRAMADEFAERATEVVGDDMPDHHWFRTTHSACFRLLDLEMEDVVDDEDRGEVCEELRLPHTFSTHDDDRDWEWAVDAPGGATDALGDQLFHMRSHCLNTKRDPATDWKGMNLLKQTREELAFRGGGSIVGTFNETYEEYKADRGLVDFEDMLIETLEAGLVPPVRVLLEDEFQDKTPLQVDLHEMWANEIERTYVGGDPNQAIYGFFGTDPEFMYDAIDAAAETRVLDTSYRFGPELWEMAESVLEGHGVELPDVEPVGETTVTRIGMAEYRRRVEDEPERDSLHLTRTNHFGSQIADMLQEAGVPFTARGKMPRWTDRMVGFYNGVVVLHTVAATMAEEFGAPDFGGLGLAEAKQVLPALPADMFSGNKKPKIEKLEDANAIRDVPVGEWLIPAELLAFVNEETPFGVLNRSAMGDLSARYKRTWRSTHGLIGDVAHQIATIHGSKGMQADTVYLYDGTTGRIEKQQAAEDEARVWFVGATRAVKNLCVVSSPRQMTYGHLNL